MTTYEPGLTYIQYLGLDQVLTAQRTRSEQHDEMLFIIAHQVYELWFKQVLHELALLQEHLENGDTVSSARTLRRVRAIVEVLVNQLGVLETMTPTQFISFRPHLAASSGFESAQFRELEAVLGRRDQRVVKRYPVGTAHRRRIADAMSRPSVLDSFVAYLERLGWEVPKDYRTRDVREPVQPSAELRDVLADVYRADDDAVLICELLLDLDEGIQLWRHRHVKMVERTIGHKRGTAGSAGVAYLRTTVDEPAFADLWSVRTAL
jgi:tryptophan 2,3-dioxygenase